MPEEHAPCPAFQVCICQGCLDLKGEMCDTPECIFCRRTMKEVAEYLDVLLIRPIIDGVQVEVIATSNSYARDQEVIRKLVEALELHGEDGTDCAVRDRQKQMKFRVCACGLEAALEFAKEKPC